MASTGIVDTPNSGLAARADVKCDLRLGIFDASSNNTSSAAGGDGAQKGDAEVEVYCSGMFISSVSYTIPVDGNATESVTLVGNNKFWLRNDEADNKPKINDAAVSGFDGTDSPRGLGVAGAASGGVQRREDVLLSGSILPSDIDGISGSGYGNNLDSSNNPIAHLQSFTCSVDLGREDVNELGRKTPYFRPANFPVEVTSEIEAITVSGDFVEANEFGASGLYATTASGNNINDQPIFVMLRAGYGFDLGNKNKLSSVSYGGGDAGGGNVSCTYSYTNFNQLDIQAFLDQDQLGFGGIVLSAGFDEDGISNNIGQGLFPKNIITAIP